MAILSPNAQQAAMALGKAISDRLGAEMRERINSVEMLAHYTSLDAFRKIVISKELWFSCVRDMSDRSEVTGGFRNLIAALDQYGPEFIRSVPYHNLGLRQLLLNYKPRLEQETFAFSLSDHSQADRLIMWRAYGQDGHGICAVFKKDPVLGQDANGMFVAKWVPINYETPELLRERIRRGIALVEQVLRENPSLVRIVPLPTITMILAVSGMAAVLGHKHDAFVDEREVRFIFSPLLHHTPLPTGSGIRAVGPPDGRKVFVLPLRHYPEYGVRAALPDLLDHIVIGPSDRQTEMAEEARQLLDANGLSHIAIHRSRIPYRSPRRYA